MTRIVPHDRMIAFADYILSHEDELVQLELDVKSAMMDEYFEAKSQEEANSLNIHRVMQGYAMFETILSQYTSIGNEIKEDTDEG